MKLHLKTISASLLIITVMATAATQTTFAQEPPAPPSSPFGDEATDDSGDSSDDEIPKLEAEDSDDSGKTPPKDSKSKHPPTDKDSTGDVIEELKTFPKGFNPLLAQTKITYELSKKAEITLEIIKPSGTNFLTLIDEKEIDKGKYFVWWNGTDQVGEKGDVAKPGTYTYKMTAKDPETGKTLDTAKGEVIVINYKADFENIDTPEVKATPTNQSTIDSQNAAATLALQNATSGVTAETGPAIAIYGLFPLAGFIIKRRKK